MATFRGGAFSRRQTDCPVLPNLTGAKHTRGMSNRSRFRCRDRRARAARFAVAEAACGGARRPRRQAWCPGARGPAPWRGSTPRTGLPQASLHLPDGLPPGKGCGRPELKPALAWGAPRGGAGGPSRTVTGRRAVALVAAPRARLSGCGRRGEGSESGGAFPLKKSEVK